MIMKMFDETYSSHFEVAYKSKSNFQFLEVLDYLIEAVKSINTEEDLLLYEHQWQRIELNIERLSKRGEHIARFSKVDEINNHILFLKKNLDLLHRQIGFEIFFKEKYEKLYNKTLKLKQESLESDQQWSSAYRRAQLWGGLSSFGYILD